MVLVHLKKGYSLRLAGAPSLQSAGLTKPTHVAALPESALSSAQFPRERDRREGLIHSSIHLTEHNILGPDHSDNIRQHMTFNHFRHC